MPTLLPVSENLLCFINQWGPLVIELIKALAWPITIFSIVTFFRSEIRALIPRLKKAGLSGVELSDEAEKQSDTKKIAVDLSSITTDKLTQFEGMNRTKAMTELELSLKSDLTKLIKENKFNNEQTVDYIINRLAIARLLKHFDNVYSGIFGSQIALIYKLKSNKLQKKEAKTFFDDAKEKEPEFYKEYSFSKWAMYLKNMQLVEEKDSIFTITAIGADFLQYILDNALSLEKRG
jgi:hypothetical protein